MMVLGTAKLSEAQDHGLPVLHGREGKIQHPAMSAREMCNLQPEIQCVQPFGKLYKTQSVCVYVFHLLPEPSCVWLASAGRNLAGVVDDAEDG